MVYSECSHYFMACTFYYLLLLTFDVHILSSWKEYIQYIIQRYIHNNIMDIPHNALWCIRHEVCHCIASIRFVSISLSITDIRMMYTLKQIRSATVQYDIADASLCILLNLRGIEMFIII